jgi:hypothetical protein
MANFPHTSGIFPTFPQHDISPAAKTAGELLEQIMITTAVDKEL